MSGMVFARFIRGVFYSVLRLDTCLFCPVRPSVRLCWSLETCSCANQYANDEVTITLFLRDTGWLVGWDNIVLELWISI